MLMIRDLLNKRIVLDTAWMLGQFSCRAEVSSGRMVVFVRVAPESASNQFQLSIVLYINLENTEESLA